MTSDDPRSTFTKFPSEWCLYQPGFKSAPMHMYAVLDKAWDLNLLSSLIVFCLHLNQLEGSVGHYNASILLLLGLCKIVCPRTFDLKWQPAMTSGRVSNCIRLERVNLECYILLPHYKTLYLLKSSFKFSTKTEILGCRHSHQS